jgi:glucose-1-phosphate thymidylyltransferase
VELEDAEIGPNVTLSAGASVRGSKLRDTIVGGKSRLEGCDLHDSLVGSDAVLRNVRGRVDVGDHSVVEGTAG